MPKKKKQQQIVNFDDTESSGDEVQHSYTIYIYIYD